MLKQLRPALVSVLAFTVLTGLLFPAVITGVAMVLFPHQAQGSLLKEGGRVVGSELIGQPFDGAQYFHPRPSSAGNGYDAAASSGSNLGPTSKKLVDGMTELAKAYREENGLAEGALLPADAVTRSASGLDPHISPANAMLQAARVARARGMGEADIKAYVTRHTEDRQLGVLGEPRVNALNLNLALDRGEKPAASNKEQDTGLTRWGYAVERGDSSNEK